MKTLFQKDTWQEIFGSIQKNRTRTIITMIGVLWGIFIYITLAGASKGLDNGFEKAFSSISSNSLFIWAQQTSLPYGGYKARRQIRLTTNDVDIIKKRVPAVEYIAPRNVAGVFGSSGGNVVRGAKSGTYAIYGDYPEYIKIAVTKVFDGGRFINQTDMDKKRRVAVIGERTLLELFEEDENPVGKYININNVSFKVIGVHQFRQGGGFGDDGDIYMPFATYKDLFNTGKYVGFFMMSAYQDADVVEVEKEVKSVLKDIHKIDPEDDQAIGGFNLGEIFKKTLKFADGLTFLSLVVGIATILAGVIGIGNILLISVKERTKEIGIRRALGARPSQVRTQILIESVFLTILAGIIGIILGTLILFAINMATQDLSDFPYTNPTVPLEYIFGALSMMIILGTLIGLIPAQIAVKVRPIEALREE
jgi:putative ABC transport system permease protein